LPISKYFGGHGEEVMAKMRAKYGAHAERVFYATDNKRKKNKKRKRHGVHR